MSRNYRVSLIGLGKRAKDYYFPTVVASQNCKLVSVCDSNPTRLQYYSEKYNAKGFSDYRNLIRESSTDIIIAATPHYLYKDIVEKAAIEKTHVLKEKPFATSIDDARQMTSMCREHGIHLMVALQRRLDPLYKHFPKVLKRIGRPFYVEGKYSLFVNNLSNGWRAKSEMSGGGCIIDMGYHLIDLVIWYFGLPDRVHAEHSSSALENGSYSVEDTSTIMMKYDNGLHGFLTLSRRRTPKTEYLEVLGDQGVARLERDNIQLFDAEGNISDKIERRQTTSSGQLSQVDYFTQVIRGDSPNYASPQMHIQHMSFIEACYRSQDIGSYIETTEKSHSI